ncbi:MAG: hypothetical protein AB7E23_01810 [Bacilli bacterium]
MVLLISGLEIAVIIGIMLFFALVIYLQIRRKQKGKSCCSVSGSCSSACGSCSVKEYVKSQKKDSQ